MTLVLPKNWNKKKLSELGFVGRGKSKHRPRNDPSLYGGQYPFVQTGEIKAADLYISEYIQTYNEKGLAQSKLWEPETLCITIAANIAETAILKIQACFPDSIVGFVADPNKSDVKFIKYSFDLMKRDMQNISRGTTQDNFCLEKLLSFNFLIPPLPIQRKISTILSAYDNLIENNLLRIKILEEIAQNLYREWFVNFRFPGHEKVKMVDSDLGRIPEGWEIQCAANALFVNPTVSVPKESNKAYVAMEGLSNTSMLIKVTGYRQKVSGSKYKNGDTLFARITPCLENGKTGFVQFLSSDSESGIGSTEFIVLRSKTLTPEYVYFMARSDNFRESAIKSMSGASGRQRVQNEAFKKFQFAHPDKGCLIRFSEIVSPIFTLVHQLSKKNDNLRQTRDLLLPRLISGELDVSNLDIKVGGTE